MRTGDINAMVTLVLLTLMHVCKTEIKVFGIWLNWHQKYCRTCIKEIDW